MGVYTKIAFVLGATAGYVLGARAGRKRYDQIKAGAQRVWETPLVQAGADQAKGFVGDRAGAVGGLLLTAASSALRVLSEMLRGQQSSGATSAARREAADAEGATRSGAPDQGAGLGSDSPAASAASGGAGSAGGVAGADVTPGDRQSSVDAATSRGAR